MGEEGSKTLSLTVLFQRRLREVSGEYFALPAVSELERVLPGFIDKNGIRSVVLAGSPLTDAVRSILEGKVQILADFGRETYDRSTAIKLCSEADLGITGTDALVAATGSVVVISRGMGDRLCAALPAIHLVIAVEAPVFKDIESFLRIMPRDLTYTLVTGPSRTADIEKQLVLGAHGPKRVVVCGPM